MADSRDSVRGLRFSENGFGAPAARTMGCYKHARESMGRSSDHSPRRLFAMAIAVLGACGGTSGVGSMVRLVNSDPASGSDTSIVATSSAADAASDPPLEAGDSDGGDAGNDAADPLDAALYDRTVPMRPPPKDTGAPFVPVESGVDAADGGWQPGASDGGPATYAILAAQGPGCLKILNGVPDPASCPVMNHCLDPVSIGAGLGGGLCEFFDAALGTGEIGDPTQNCLQTLKDILSSGCGASQQLTPCLCGDADVTACVSGTAVPNGPVYPDYVRSFNRTNGAEISADFSLTTFGAGMANQLANCLASFNCDCLDGGH